MRFSYRFQQLLRNLRSQPNSEMLGHAAQVLTPGQLLLFRSMSPADQAHSLRVMQSLRQRGRSEKHLLAAALLHDVGKARHPLRVWERALIVIIQSLSPRLADRLAQGEVDSWQRPFVIAAHHPRWGAEMVDEVGGSIELIELIRSHQDEPETIENGDLIKDLRVLQAADNRN